MNSPCLFFESDASLHPANTGPGTVGYVCLSSVTQKIAES